MEKARVFLEVVMEYYRAKGRHDLPWRAETYLNPYAIAVSEVMLQQTQVARVVDYFQKWMVQFPDIETLANASNEEVLVAWQGLGYNNRGLRLKKLAQVVLSEYSGVCPRDRKSLEALPGIGPYTAGAIRAFVWNEPEVFIETNIRRVFIYHFFEGQERVNDKDVQVMLTRVMEYFGGVRTEPPPDPLLKRGGNPTPREWYWALMDYGATLPKILKSNPNKQSKHHSTQSRFEGSVRQVRSGILKWLLENKSMQVGDIANVLGIVNPQDERIGKAVKGLERDGVVTLSPSSPEAYAQTATRLRLCA